MNADIAVALSQVSVIHTLGPPGTNCEAAAREWFARQQKEGDVVLYRTLETALESMPTSGAHALLGCIVYPDLHTLMFSNIQGLVLGDCFMVPTFNMLLASRDGAMPRSVSCHPAPKKLVPETCTVEYVNSNAQAAIACSEGVTDGCITTLPAATKYGLKIVRDYGPILMGFTIHIHDRSVSSRGVSTSEELATIPA